jgi:hypothetical protein
MNVYFCDNPECEAHVKVEVTEHRVFVREATLEVKELRNEHFRTEQGKRLGFCHVCASAIKMFIEGRIPGKEGGHDARKN